MVEAQLREKAEAVRRFNRFYTNRNGLLKPGLLKTQFPLTQARMIFELAQHDDLTRIHAKRLRFIETWRWFSLH